MTLKEDINSFADEPAKQIKGAQGTLWRNDIATGKPLERSLKVVLIKSPYRVKTNHWLSRRL